MKKRKLNFNFNTVLTAVLCVLAAISFWLFAKYMEGASLFRLVDGLARLGL